MLFIMLPTGHLRYFLPLSLIVGGSVSGYLPWSNARSFAA